MAYSWLLVIVQSIFSKQGVTRFTPLSVALANFFKLNKVGLNDNVNAMRPKKLTRTPGKNLIDWLWLANVIALCKINAQIF
jgi:hypothetical protein